MAQAGFILTRHWRDTPQGTEVSFWLATDNGPVQATLAPQESVAFIPTSQTSRAASLLQAEKDYRLTPLQLRDFHRQPVSGLYCRTHRQLMRMEKLLRENGVTVYEADVRPPERYLMERFITSPVWVDGEMRNGVIRNARLKPHPDYRPPLKWVSLDIETTRHGELYCIGLEGCGQRTVYMLGPANGDDRQLDFELVYVASRPQLLEKLNAGLPNMILTSSSAGTWCSSTCVCCKNMPNATVSLYGWGETIANWSGANMASKRRFSPVPEGESLSMVSTRLNPRSGIFRLFRWKPSRRNCSAKENPLRIPGSYG